MCQYLDDPIVLKEINVFNASFVYSTLIKYTLVLPPTGSKIRIDTIDEPYFKIPFIEIILSRSPSSHKTTHQSHNNMRFILIQGEELITEAG